MFFLRDIPKYEVIHSYALRYPEVDPGAVRAFLTLLRVGSDVLDAFERFLAGHKISQGSFTVLMVLNREPGVGQNPSVMAQKCGVTRATMTGLINGLERKQLIRRESAQSDRRTVLIYLTAKGIELLEGMVHDYYARVALLMADLPEGEKETFSKMLHKIGHRVQFVHPKAKSIPKAPV